MWIMRSRSDVSAWIALMNLSENSLTYSALAGFLQSIGLAPDRYLEGMLEE